MINKALRDRALPIPDEAMMHDWWLALVAAAFGQIGHIAEPTLFYRQHESSSIGAKPWNKRMAFHLLRDIANTIRHIKKVSLQEQSQATILLERYRDVLRDSDNKMIETYSHLSKENYFIRRYHILKYRFFFTDRLRTIGWLLIA
jgi:hypothetical protein